MKAFNSELIKKAKAAKTAEELMEIHNFIERM